MTERVILLRVGIDSGSGGIQSPMFDGGGFELLPIPDGLGVESRTYGNLTGRHGRPLVDYFPVAQRSKRARDGVHFDPEFEGFTYGDPGTNKRGLLKLGAGDVLVFYAGLQQWAPETGFVAGTEVLGIVGYFEVAEATLAGQLGDDELASRFATNAHVRHPSVLADQRDRLILVRGGSGSRLLERAVPISEIGADRNGTPIKVLSRSMREVFSDFDGRVAIQRSMPRTVPDSHTSIAADFVRSIGTTEQQPGPSTSARVVPITSRSRGDHTMKTEPPRNDINGMAESMLLLPGYELEGDSVIPPCRLGQAFVKFDGEWVIGPHGAVCPECVTLMSGPPPELDDEQIERELDAELEAIAHQFTVLRMMLRAADARRIELLVAGAEDRMRRGDF